MIIDFRLCGGGWPGIASRYPARERYHRGDYPRNSRGKSQATPTSTRTFAADVGLGKYEHYRFEKRNVKMFGLLFILAEGH